jgi:hypothetical protein
MLGLPGNFVIPIFVVIANQGLVIDSKGRDSAAVHGQGSNALALVFLVAVLGFPRVPGFDFVAHVPLPPDERENQQRIQHHVHNADPQGSMRHEAVDCESDSQCNEERSHVFFFP